MRKIKFSMDVGYEDYSKIVEYDDETPDSVIEADLEKWRDSFINSEWKEVTRVKGQYVARITVKFNWDAHDSEYISFRDLQNALENGEVSKVVEQAIHDSVGEEPETKVEVVQIYGKAWQD